MNKAGLIVALSQVLGMTSIILSGIDPTDTRLMEQLKQIPPEEYVRPPYPKRVRKQ